MKPSNQQ